MERTRSSSAVIPVALAGWALLAFALATARPAGAGAATSAAPTDSLALCDQTYLAGDPQESAAIARRILARDPRQAAAAWRLSRALIARSNLAGDKARRRGLLVEAREWAETAVREDATGSQGFTCLAICQGNLSGLAGGRDRIALAEAARQAAERALALDQDNDLAWLVLGVWNREVATVGGLQKVLARVFYGGVPAGASLERAETCLRRAAALAPGHVNHHRELGITLMARGRYDEAIQELERAVALPPALPGDAAYQADARRRLREARDRRDHPDPGTE